MKTYDREAGEKGFFLLLLFAVSAAALTGCSETAKTGSVYSDNLSEERYELEKPRLGLDFDYEFQFELDPGVELDPEENGAEASEAGGMYAAARVFADGALTMEVPCDVMQLTYDDENYLMVTAAHVDAETQELGVEDDLLHRETKRESGGTWRWYGYGGYYLVRYVGADGNRLEKPEVTYFTVKDDVDDEKNRMDSPQDIQFAVADDGGLSISWLPVEGAKSYKVYMQDVDAKASRIYDRYRFQLLAETSETSVNTLDYDETTRERQEKYESQKDDPLGLSNVAQNSQFADFVIGDNEDTIFQNRLDTEEYGSMGLEVSDYIPNGDKVRSVSISVVAVGEGEDQQSPLEFRSINSLLGQIPIEKAYALQYSYNAQTPDSETDPTGYLEHEMFTYVTMADGTAAVIVNELDTDNMMISEATVYSGPDEMHVTKKVLTRYTIPYRVKNSVISGNILVYSDSFPGGAGEISERAQEAVQTVFRESPGAGLPARAQIESSIDWNQYQKDQQPATEMADVPYQVNGSSDYVKFVASNLLAGNIYMDITPYASRTGAPDIEDVVGEAVWQNPLILSTGSCSINETEKDGHIYVTVLDWTPAGIRLKNGPEMVELRKQVDEEAQKLVDGAVSDGMSDEDKVRAIDEAICQRLEYDYDYFYMAEGKTDQVEDDSLNAFDVRGYSAAVLLDSNQAICMGYAEIFKLCADKAGLTSVAVSGQVPPRAGYPNNGHAWNLVQMDGQWKVVDTTWDDAGDSSNEQYLLIGQDSENLAGRTYNRDALLDSVIGDYVEPQFMEP